MREFEYGGPEDGDRLDNEQPEDLGDDLSDDLPDDLNEGVTPHDLSDDAEALASAGFGTDEDYGFFGPDEY